MTSQYNFILNYRKETDLNKLINDIIKEKLSQKDKSKLTKQFFVIIPTQTELNGSNLKLALMNSNSNNTLFCQFKKDMTSVAVMNQDGTIQKIIPLTN